MTQGIYPAFPYHNNFVQMEVVSYLQVAKRWREGSQGITKEFRLAHIAVMSSQEQPTEIVTKRLVTSQPAAWHWRPDAIRSGGARRGGQEPCMRRSWVHLEQLGTDRSTLPFHSPLPSPHKPRPSKWFNGPNLPFPTPSPAQRIPLDCCRVQWSHPPLPYLIVPFPWSAGAAKSSSHGGAARLQLLISKPTLTGCLPVLDRNQYCLSASTGIAPVLVSN
ncbi:hypothetical protein HaLaN_18153, partial [Haematococcus lacustris]